MQEITLAQPAGYDANRSEEEVEMPVKKRRRLSEEERKMFNTSLDPYDAPLHWWESEHVKYAISYNPVRFRLLSLMESDIVRLTDRKYMVQLASRIQQDRELKQKERIDRRKLPLPTVITKLLEVSDKVFRERLLRRYSRKSSTREE